MGKDNDMMLEWTLDQDVVDGRDVGSGRRSEVLEGMLDSDVVAGRDVVNWKAWKGTAVVDGRDVGSEGTVIGRVGSGWVGRRLEGLDQNGDLKGW